MKRFLPFLTMLFFVFGLNFLHAQNTITVNTTDDEINSDGDCSLREAIQAANTNLAVDGCSAGGSGGVDIINIPNNTYSLNTIGTSIEISSSMTLNGTSEAGTIIQAHPSAGTATDRVFLVVGSGYAVTFEDMTVRHGVRTGGGASNRGAGINISSGGGTGTVTMTRVTLNQNAAEAAGGGLHINSGLATLTMTDCTISDNEGFSGGGMRNSGATSLNMNGCIISGNNNINHGDGGGIQIVLSSSTNTFTNCSFVNNSALIGDSAGGAIRFSGGAGTFINCTFSGNSVATNGGAINNVSTGISLYNCTIVNNSSVGSGGGLNTSQNMTITNTIIANNTAGSGGNDVRSSATISQTTSLVEDCSGTCPTWSYTSDPNLAGVATCGSRSQSYFEPQSPSDAINNGTAPGGSIPASDICGSAISISKDIGSREFSGVLPVELTYLRVQIREAQSLLTWQTASEIQNEGFDIEWSVDGRVWKSIGFVKGAGDTSEKQSYSYLHQNPESGINYYRLKQMDYDGAFEYSDIVIADLAKFDHLSKLKIFPNPIQNGEMTLSLPEIDLQSANLELFDASGQLVLRQTISHSTTQLNVGKLPNGLYWLKVYANRQTIQEKVLIQH